MCGIAGFLGDYSAQTLARMSARIEHRGPDGEGAFFDPEAKIGLAHRRLAILDLSEAGSQPMTDTSGRFEICYNGEIYNSVLLRDELISEGVVFRGHSDTEVLLELLSRKGFDHLSRLNGIFAFALWDRQTHELHLVRDGLGVKPLYLTQTKHGFAFASEFKALLEIDDLDRTLDPVAAAAYVTYLYSPGARTMLRSVEKVEPGTRVTLTFGGKRQDTRYYSLPDPNPIPRKVDALIQDTRDHLGRAVERQLLADVEVGAFLSGGLDSSSIVALAKKSDPDRDMQCFTIDYASEGSNHSEMISDLPFARQAAKHIGVDLHEVRVDATMANDFAELIYMLDEPQADPAALNNLYISRLARQSGIKVLLSGAGGDDFFTGYRRHKAARIDGFIGAVPSRVRTVLADGSRRLPVERTWSRRLRKLAGTMRGNDEERIAALFEWLPAETVASLLATDCEVTAAAITNPMVQSAAEPALRTGLDRALRLDQRYFLTDHNLNYTDKTGMAAGVEIRVPFLDPDLIQFAANLPKSAKIHRGETKWILRKAMEPFLPHSVIYRPKTGFGVPLRSWMRNELKPMMAELLSQKTVEDRGLFDCHAVRSLQQRTDAGEIDGSYTLLAIASIELWCRRFIDQ